MTVVVPYVYRVVAVEKVTDGDTVWLTLDVGFRQSILVDIRVFGIDCPETRAGSVAEREAGRHATEVTATFLLAHAGNLWVRTEKAPDSFGRWLGEVWAETDQGPLVLGDVLRAQGLASVWPQRWHDAYGV